MTGQKVLQRGLRRRFRSCGFESGSCKFIRARQKRCGVVVGRGSGNGRNVCNEGRGSQSKGFWVGLGALEIGSALFRGLDSEHLTVFRLIYNTGLLLLLD